jgi:hypothetical protein
MQSKDAPACLLPNGRVYVLQALLLEVMRILDPHNSLNMMEQL